MQRRPIDTEVTELAQALGILIRRVRAAAADYELSLTEATVLGRLEQHGSLTTAELARMETMKPQSMGATVAALEKRHLVQRTPHATDGRQLLVSLTAKGAEMRKALHDAKHSWFAEALSRLDRDEQQTLFATGKILRKMASE